MRGICVAICPRIRHSSWCDVDIVLTYDIADTDGPGARRLRQISRVCEKYGERIQFSVFECRISPTRFARLLSEVRDVINADEDSVVVYRFPGDLADWKVRLGKDPEHEIGQPWIA